MKTCKDYIKALPDYLAGTLPEQQSGAMSAHIAACTNCRKEAERINRVANAFLEPRQVSVNPFLYTRIQSRLMQPAKEQRTLAARLLQPLAYVTVLFLGVYLGIQIGTSSNEVAAENSHTEAYVQTQYFNEMKLDPLSETMLQVGKEKDDIKNKENDEHQK